jgi:hypothetical protein
MMPRCPWSRKNCNSRCKALVTMDGEQVCFLMENLTMQTNHLNDIKEMMVMDRIGGKYGCGLDVPKE